MPHQKKGAFVMLKPIAGPSPAPVHPVERMKTHKPEEHEKGLERQFALFFIGENWNDPSAGCQDSQEQENSENPVCMERIRCHHEQNKTEKIQEDKGEQKGEAEFFPAAQKGDGFQKEASGEIREEKNPKRHKGRTQDHEIIINRHRINDHSGLSGSFARI